MVAPCFGALQIAAGTGFVRCGDTVAVVRGPFGRPAVTLRLLKASLANRSCASKTRPSCSTTIARRFTTSSTPATCRRRVSAAVPFDSRCIVTYAFAEQRSETREELPLTLSEDKTEPVAEGRITC